VSARKIVLLLLILGLGAVLETAWTVRGAIDVGPEGCRVLGGRRFYGPSFSFEESGRQELPPGARVEVVNAFGHVRVTAGKPGEVTVALRKVVFLPTEERAKEFASHVALVFETRGDALRVSTNRAEPSRGDRIGLETHLDVAVPPDAAVQVDNEHGRVEVRDAASADVTSSHDAVEVERIKGAVNVKSKHGDVSVAEVGGDLRLESRHGDMTVKDVKGRAQVDGKHGGVTVTGAGGLELDVAFGDARLEDVRGDLRVKGEHSGVQASGIAGRATIETSFDGVELKQVGGEAQVKVEHGEAKVRDAKAAVTVVTSYDGVELENVVGPAEVTVSHGGLRAQRVQKGLRVKSSGDDVDLVAVEGPLQVEAERGGVSIEPQGPLTDEVSIRTTHGAIRLQVPRGSRFQLDAQAERGAVEVDVPGLKITRTDDRHVQGSLGGGGSVVKLHADGDVTVEAHTAAAAGEL
jgi:DUF4097 and DUF4098 domain-containing protein YvlB